ncbi:MAG: hypothetical protein ABWZ79_05885 [Pedobacter agri]
MSKIAILRNIQQKKSGGYVLENRAENVVAIVKKGKAHKYINQNERSNITEMEIKDAGYLIEPHIPIDLERFIIFLSAESGSGKTLLSSILIEQYIANFPDFPVYYLCNTRKEDDINLASIKKLQQLDSENLEEITIEDLTDCLVVIDDTDFHKDHKKIMKFMNIIVECGRKFGVSLIYSSHIHSKLSESPIYKEVSLYITFPNSLINNRMIQNNLKIDENVVRELICANHSFICFNKIYRTIITDQIIMKY